MTDAEEGEKTKAAESPARLSPEVLSFKAVIVMTTAAGTRPTLESVDTALRKLGAKYVMPASVESPIVMSLSDE